MGAAAIFKHPKSRYLDNGLTDRHEIWHGEAIRYLWCDIQLEIRNFKNPIWRRLPYWKIEKSPYLGRSFSRVTQFGPRDRLVRYKFDI